MTGLPKLLLRVYLIAQAGICCGQGPPSPVAWRFRAAPLSGHETTLVITANVAPGWHLYSQNMTEGGPMPTRFTFEPGYAYMLVGTTEEKGNAATFYDNTFEMNITWFSGSVEFSQRVTLNAPVTAIKGKVEYMTCNNELCVPSEQAFSIKISP